MILVGEEILCNTLSVGQYNDPCRRRDTLQYFVWGNTMHDH